ncbi:MAG: prepilin-type N-terminal cleavage/methylation domain-containing protein, partial [Verrucomicrobiae bacterium]|nr:prepilin-type N-terminal cleavage/methylation domain-containing protein [Verrucomicrobiae bacterium]
MCMLSRLRHDRGFTLVEIMI